MGSQIVDFEELLIAIKNNKDFSGTNPYTDLGMYISVFIRLHGNRTEFTHINLGLHIWKICVFAANSIQPAFDYTWLMEENAETANIKREYEGGDVHEYAQTNLFENIAYDANHCENCDRIGFSSEIVK